jgi:hypothetical protein
MAYMTSLCVQEPKSRQFGATKVKDNAVVTVMSLSWFKAPALVTFGICLVGIVDVVIAKAAAPKLAL